MTTESEFAASFDQAGFEHAIRETMKMGMPQTEAAQLHWCWEQVKTFEQVDSSGAPYDFNATPTAIEPGNPDLPASEDAELPQELVVLYALEFSARPAGSTETVLGEIDQSRAIVTMLDAEFEQIKTADYCILDDTRYIIQFAAPTLGLFGSMVHQAYLVAEDEH